MDITLEKNGNVAGKIIVKVEEADYAEKVTAKLKEIGKTHTIPGFRKGHIDIVQLRRRFGRDVKSDVINHEVYEAVMKYIRENNINIIGSPLPVDVKEINLTDKDYTFEYEIGIAPELNVTVDKSVELPWYRIEVSPEMVAEQDKQFRERFGEQTTGDTVDEKAVVKGVLMELNADGTVREDEGAIQVTNGIVAPFLFKDKEEAAKFMGKHVDDKVDFNPWKTCEGNPAEMASMLNVDKEQAAEVKADFRMTISEIMVLKLAEHNQEFYDNVFGKDKVTDEAGYEQAIRGFIQQSLDRNTFQLFARDAQQWLDRTYGEFELPEDFIKRLLKANYEELAKDEEKLELESKAAMGQLRWQLVTDAASRALDVKITEDDLKARAEFIARQQFAQYGIYNMDDETIAASAKRLLSDAKTREHLYNDIHEDALMIAIQKAVTLKEETVSLDRFRELAAAEK